MKKIFLLLSVLCIAASVMAQSQLGDFADNGNAAIVVTPDDAGKTIVLHPGQQLEVQFNEFSSEASSCVTRTTHTSFDPFSNVGILSMSAPIPSSSLWQMHQQFTAHKPGQTILRYRNDEVTCVFQGPKRWQTEQVSYFSFNIIVE